MVERAWGPRLVLGDGDEAGCFWGCLEDFHRVLEIDLRAGLIWRKRLISRAGGVVQVVGCGKKLAGAVGGGALCFRGSSLALAAVINL